MIARQLVCAEQTVSVPVLGKENPLNPYLSTVQYCTVQKFRLDQILGESQCSDTTRHNMIYHDVIVPLGVMLSRDDDGILY